MKRTEHDYAARRLVVARSRINREDPLTTIRTLREIGQVTLHDFIKPPGFDGFGNANTDTQEWRDWATANDLVDDSRRLSHYLRNAQNQLAQQKPPHWWPDNLT
jgi:hypothetical protein